MYLYVVASLYGLYGLYGFMKFSYGLSTIVPMDELPTVYVAVRPSSALGGLHNVSDLSRCSDLKSDVSAWAAVGQSLRQSSR